jgi:hypothetical protein
MRASLAIALLFLCTLTALAEDVAADALADIDWLLKPQHDVPLSKWPTHFQLTYTNAILHVRWVARSELLARQAFWQDYQTHPDPKAGVNSSETEESLLLFDNSVCEYRQSIIVQGGLSDDNVWRRWLPPAKGADWYFRTLKLAESKDVLNEPTGTSWCVIMTYIRDGEARVKHFYLPARIHLQTLLAGAYRTTKDCQSWPMRDERFGRAEWITNNLKYDDKIWKTDE